MLATERLERSSTGPSWRSRFAASLLESPPGWLPSLTLALLAEAARVNATDRGARGARARVASSGSMKALLRGSRAAVAPLLVGLVMAAAATAHAAPGDVYVADEEAGGAPGDGRVFRLPPTGGLGATELAASTLFGDPGGMTLLRDGRLAVADGTFGAVYAVDRATGAVSTLFSGDPLDFPSDVAQAPDGTLLVADAKTNVLVRLTLGGGATPLASFADPTDIAGLAVMRNGTALVSEPAGGARIYRVSSGGAVSVLTARHCSRTPRGWR